MSVKTRAGSFFSSDESKTTVSDSASYCRLPGQDLNLRPKQGKATYRDLSSQAGGAGRDPGGA